MYYVTRLIVALFVLALFAALIVATVEAKTGPGEFTCDLTDWYLNENKEIVRVFLCNENTAQRGTTCHLWRTTTTEEGSSDGKTTSLWYMCNEFTLMLPVIVR